MPRRYPLHAHRMYIVRKYGNANEWHRVIPMMLNIQSMARDTCSDGIWTIDARGWMLRTDAMIRLLEMNKNYKMCEF